MLGIGMTRHKFPHKLMRKHKTANGHSWRKDRLQSLRYIITSLFTSTMAQQSQATKIRHAPEQSGISHASAAQGSHTRPPVQTTY